MRTGKKSEPKVVGLIGIGLDSDGHRRITEGEDVLLVGGTQETHEEMQEVVIKVGEALERKGKQLREASAAELADLIRNAKK